MKSSIAFLVVAFLGVPTAGFGQDKVDIHRLVIYNGSNISVTYYSSKASPVEMDLLQKLSRSQSEPDVIRLTGQQTDPGEFNKVVKTINETSPRLKASLDWNEVRQFQLGGPPQTTQPATAILKNGVIMSGVIVTADAKTITLVTATGEQFDILRSEIAALSRPQ